MNKTTYILGILFLSLATAAGVLHSILLLWQGLTFVYAQSYASWYLLSSLIYLIAHLFVLTYFFSKGWRFVFICALLSLTIFIVQAIIQYIILVNVARELGSLHSMVAMVSLLSTILLSIALIRQARQERVLLALAVLMILYSVTLMGSLVVTMLGSFSQTLVNIIIWTNAAGSLFPVAFIIVFYKETKRLPSVAHVPLSKTMEGIYTTIAGLGMIAVVTLVIMGSQLSKETYWNVEWQKRGPVESRKLAERFESRIYVASNNDTLHYLFLKPLNYDSTQRYPIVTCLHGGPTRVASNVEVTQPAPLLSQYENRKKYPAFLFVPQARPGVLWGGIPTVPSMGNLVSEAMEAIEKEFSVDPDRRYLTGVSGGGYGTWHFICTYPDRFAAAMPICGAGDPALADKITHVPVWAFHGDVDRNVPVTGSRNMIEAIKKAGGDPRYSEFPGIGHNVWPEVEKTDGVLDWMFAQSRSDINRD